MGTPPPPPESPRGPGGPPPAGPGAGPGNGNGHARPVRVLLIDDDEDDYVLTRDLVGDIPGGRVALDWASTYEAGLDALCGGAYDAYLLDYRLGAKTGIDLLREAHARGRSGPVILLTGQGHSRTDLDALRAGADDYLEKAGLTPALLDRAIRYALAKHAAGVELERKVAERTEQLGRANAALVEADRRKDEFLSTLGHELRNPLAPILTALEIMRLAGDNPDMVARQRERLERQVAQMVRLVEDLLDVSRITTGKLRIVREPVALQEVLDAALEISRPNLEKAGVTLVADVPADRVPLEGDRVRLAQVFSNLLNNAAKYTEPGGRVTLAADRRAQAAPLRDAPVSDSAVHIPFSEVVRVRVCDTGVGIAAEQLPRLFDLFTQADRTANRSQGGLGVGLALVRRLVEMHGGTVVAHSDGPGKGAEFTVTLPVAG